MKKITIPIFLFAIACPVLESQTAPATLYDRESERARVDALAEQLRFGKDQAGYLHYLRVRDDITQQIRDEIDTFVAHSVDPGRPATDVAADVRIVLGSHTFQSEYGDDVFASINMQRGRPTLILGYMLARGGAAVNDSAISIRAYCLGAAGRYELADATGSDLDGYGLFVRSLPSPLAGEEWFLAWGPLSGYNGTRDRLRVYAFDGERFRTVWSPDDFLDASVVATLSGFSVKHLDVARYSASRPPYGVVDEFVPVGDGVRLVSTQAQPN